MSKEKIVISKFTVYLLQKFGRKELVDLYLTLKKTLEKGELKWKS